MTDADYDVCDIQGDLFALAAEQGYEVCVFAEAYLSSEFCRRAFDCLYSRYQHTDAEESWEMMQPEIGSRLKKYEDGTRFRRDIAAWMGFTYRQLWYETGVYSARLVQKIPPREMARLYMGYHTLDEEMAAERLIESYGLR